MVIKYIILGAIQGLSEFLPVSSSGHLVIAQKLLHISQDNISLDIILHLASLTAVLFFCRGDIIAIMRAIFTPLEIPAIYDGDEIDKVLIPHRKGRVRLPSFLTGFTYLLGSWRKSAVRRTDELRGYRNMALFVIYASLVTAIIGFIAKDLFERMFSSILVVAVCLAITGTILFFTKFKIKEANRKAEQLSALDGLWVGLAQGLAIAPGISRSGLTVSSGIFRGLERTLAVRLSFLMAIPAIVGAGLLKIKELQAINIPSGYLLAGFLSAFVFTIVALKLLVTFVQKSKLHYFAYYCWSLSGILFYNILLTK